MRCYLQLPSQRITKIRHSLTQSLTSLVTYSFRNNWMLAHCKISLVAENLMSLTCKWVHSFGHFTKNCLHLIHLSKEANSSSVLWSTWSHCSHRQYVQTTAISKARSVKWCISQIKMMILALMEKVGDTKTRVVCVI